MPAALSDLRITEDAYFEMLEKSIDKYEYWNGVAIRKSGALPGEAVIEGNMVGELFQQLRGMTCRPLSSNQLVKLSGSTGYVFPDVTVVCDRPEYVLKGDVGCLLNPTVLIEVLSPGTVCLDETDKFFAYTRISSVREYLVVSGNRYAIKHFFRRTPEETWWLHLFESPNDRVDLKSCGCTLSLAEIYGGVDFDA